MSRGYIHNITNLLNTSRENIENKLSKKSVTVTNNSPIQDYVHPDDTIFFYSKTVMYFEISDKHINFLLIRGIKN